MVETKVGLDATAADKVLPLEVVDGPIKTEIALAGAGLRPLLTLLDHVRRVAGAERGLAPRSAGPVLLAHLLRERDCFHKLVADVILSQTVLLSLNAQATAPPRTPRIWRHN
uniref:Uncharacterized protein n=1 Tax=Peronospora matthiolae TaxID=2874970 RepID=A0AAV1U6S0_9STRA